MWQHTGKRTGEDKGDIVLRRDHKYNAAEGYVPYTSEHEYRLGDLGYTRIAALSDPEGLE